MAYASPYSFLPDDHMRVVGIIAFHWEAVELALQRAIAEITMTADTGGSAVLTDMIGFRSKTDIIMAYARPLQTTAPADWRKFCDALECVKNAYTLRNKFVHARWVDGPDSLHPALVDFRISGGRLRQEEVPTDIAELNSAASSIYEAGEQIMAWLQAHGLMRPSPKTQD